MLRILACGLLFSAAIAMAQDGSGTVNSLTLTPVENQDLTGALGTTTGGPNDVTPGSVNMRNGLVPVTSKMTGSGNDGDLNLTPSATAPPKPATTASAQQQAQPAKKKSANSGSAARTTRPNTTATNAQH